MRKFRVRVFGEYGESLETLRQALSLSRPDVADRFEEISNGIDDVGLSELTKSQLRAVIIFASISLIPEMEKGLFSGSRQGDGGYTGIDPFSYFENAIKGFYLLREKVEQGYPDAMGVVSFLDETIADLNERSELFKLLSPQGENTLLNEATEHLKEWKEFSIPKLEGWVKKVHDYLRVTPKRSLKEMVVQAKDRLRKQADES